MADLTEEEAEFADDKCDELHFVGDFDDGFCDDGVDCAKLIEVIEDDSIPLKYHRSQGIPKHEPSTEYRLVHDGWGQKLSPIVDVCGTYAILYMRQPLRTAADVVSFVKSVHKLCDVKLEALRWNVQHLFVYLKKDHYYPVLGDAFMNAVLDKVGNVSVGAIEPAVFYHAPSVFVEISGHDCDDVYSVISPLVLPFSGSFTYLRLRHTDVRKFNAIGDCGKPHPSVCIGLLFDGKHQNLALKSLNEIPKNNWNTITLPDAVTNVLDLGLQYFVHKTLDVPMISVKTGATNPGVQITVFVRDAGNYDKMVQFYSGIVKGKPVTRDVADVKLRYSTLAISCTAELIVAYYPGLTVAPSQNVTVYLKVDSRVENFPGFAPVSRGFWQAYDPESNRVVLFQMIR